jgi:acyl carrier protein
MADRDAVFEQVAALVRKYAPGDTPIEPATELGTDLSIDSVAAMDLIMEVEDRFHIDIPINQVADLRTVQDLVNLVLGQLEGSA